MSADNKFYKLFLMPAIATLVLLLIPLIAKADWSPMDFIIAGILLFSTGSTYKLLTYKRENLKFKFAAAIACAAGIFLIWANLAVGIVGSEDNPVNVVYFGVIAIGIIGAVVSRFRADRLAYTMFAMAGAIVLIPIVLFIVEFNLPDIFKSFGIHGFYFVLFVSSALLFYQAAQELPSSKTKHSTNN